MDNDALKATAVPAEESSSGEPPKPTKDLLEKTWDFFSSVPVATVLLFIIAAASVAGTLIEQEGQYQDWRPAADFYPARYGPVMGNLLFKLGLTRMYTSWWFLTLLLLLGASLVVCSLERFIPLWRAVQRPNTAPPEAFVRRLKNGFEVRVTEPLTAVAEALRSQRYRVVVQENRLYADKGRWGRWGPYITHIGLLLILVGAMGRAVPGFYSDQTVWVRDGAVVRVPGADWYVRNEKFTVEYYPDGQPKFYQTDATVIDEGKEVKRANITMNNPLWYRWTELYQSSYQVEYGSAQVAVLDRASGKTLGTFQVDLAQPANEYTAGGYKFKIKDYFPEFQMDDQGKPNTASAEALNPAFTFDVTPPEGQAYNTWFFVLYPEMEFDTKTPVKLQTLNTAQSATTGLRVKQDLGIPVIYAGLIIVSLGVFLTFYVAHRRYWAFADGGKATVGGWTNRNQRSFKTEVTALATRLDPATNPPVDLKEGEER